MTQYGYGRHHSAAVVHVVSTKFAPVDHGAGRRYMRWACGGGSMDPVLTDSPPPFMRRCGKCSQERSVPAGVYFAERDGLIKIGCSAHPARRVDDLGARFLASHAGDYETERTLHRVFADDCEHGEWFRPSHALLAYIERVAAEHAVVAS